MFINWFGGSLFHLSKPWNMSCFFSREQRRIVHNNSSRLNETKVGNGKLNEFIEKDNENGKNEKHHS